MTALRSKVVSEYSDQLAEMAVEAILKVAREENGKYNVRLDDVKVEKKAGGSVMETKLINGIVLDKEIVHSGMPRKIVNAKIAILNSPLEIEKTEFDAKISIERPEQIKAFLEEEQKILKEMVDKIVEAGANVVLCQKGIDDIAQHYLAKAGVIAVRRVKESDIEKASKATGARIVTSVNELSEDDLGYAGLVEERKVGEDKWVFIEQCKDPRSVTILIRGGTEKMVDEADRALHDALCVVKDVVTYPYIVAGAGAPEIEVAMRIRKKAETISGKEQLAVLRFTDALESIPSALAENAGMDPIDIIAELRKQHEAGNKWYGIDIVSKKTSDSWAAKVVEPLLVKEQIVKSASEAASMILRIDDVIAAGKLKEKGPPKPPSEEGGAGELD
jgi:chaperonin GroEL (HSP60 family)